VLALLSAVTGILYAAGLYMILRRTTVKALIGLALLGHAANLLLFGSGGITRGRPPLVPEGATAPAGAVADPLPQALVLTAIVISFGVLAFATALVLRVYQTAGTDDVDELREKD
jgi:multicomponent Na+:H+ antiporter subunit C